MGAVYKARDTKLGRSVAIKVLLDIFANDPEHVARLQREAHVSPDGKRVAYGSAESGRWEVYVASFPDFNDRRQISGGGGFQPVWRKDGKELFQSIRASDSQLAEPAPQVTRQITPVFDAVVSPPRPPDLPLRESP